MFIVHVLAQFTIAASNIEYLIKIKIRISGYQIIQKRTALTVNHLKPYFTDGNDPKYPNALGQDVYSLLL